MTKFHPKSLYSFVLTFSILHANISAYDLPPPKLQTKIVGGEQAKDGRFPYQVWLEYEGEFLCGGSIISTLLILTASHCLENRKASKFFVIAGDYDRWQPNSFRQNKTVKRVFMHENYSDNIYRLVNDIALIVLSSPLQFNSRVQNIQLPMRNEEFSGMALISGWGSTENGYLPVSVLKYVFVPLRPSSECRWRYLWSLTEFMLCAGEYGKDSCQGDSGGPAVCRRNGDGKQILCGIVSYGLGCGTWMFPGIYTKVSKFVPWIEEKANQVRCESGVRGIYCPTPIAVENSSDCSKSSFPWWCNLFESV